MICSKCGDDKLPEKFNEDRKGNKRKDCTSCQSQYNAEYYQKNREAILKYQDNFRLNNNEQIMKARLKRKNNGNN